MKSKVLDEMRGYVGAAYGEETGQSVMAEAFRRFEALCFENRGDDRAVKAHTETDIFPCIALYEALQKNGIPKDEALDFLDRSWSERARPQAAAMGRMLRFAGLYRLYPRMFRKVAQSQFGEKAGFRATFYELGPGRCKFDMTRCLFLDTCRRYGCPELTRCFCHVDDVNNQGLHPRLCWNRTQFMGGGGEVCDFDIFVVPKEGNRDDGDRKP